MCVCVFRTFAAPFPVVKVIAASDAGVYLKRRRQASAVLHRVPAVLCRAAQSDSSAELLVFHAYDRKDIP